MKIGYACLTVGIPDTKMRSVTQKNATDDKLREIIAHNLKSLKNMLLFNAQNSIKLFRISSDIIPFGSSPVNSLDWETEFKKEFCELAKIISENGIRVSMHPGQYTVLNSPRLDVVSRAIDDLAYHTKMLGALECSTECKIILHVGGVYGEREAAIARFKRVYRTLDDKIKQRLVIENDDKSYSIGDVLQIGLECGIPVVYDNLHSEIKPSGNYPHLYWIDKCAATWQEKDGTQKTHYSQQAADKLPGAHTQTIAINEFLRYVNSLSGADIDIMLEVKDKNISAVKCINTLAGDGSSLFRDWLRYKYYLLEHSYDIYESAKKIVETSAVAREFYLLTEKAFKLSPTVQSRLLAAKAVWKELESAASDKEKQYFKDEIELLERGDYDAVRMKKILLSVAQKQHNNVLKTSFYFHL